MSVSVFLGKNFPRGGRGKRRSPGTEGIWCASGIARRLVGPEQGGQGR